MTHNLDPIIKAYTRWLTDDVKHWKYIGWKPVDKGKHLDTLVFTYYQRKIDGKMQYINVKVTKTYGEVPYAIMRGVGKISKGKVLKST